MAASTTDVLGAPIALQEMVLAVLLIVRGSDTSRIGPRSDGPGQRTTIDLRSEQHA